LSQDWTDLRVLITGPCGTVGRELLAQLVARGPREIIGIDNNESELFLLSQEYRDRPEVRLLLGDVRDPSALMRRARGVDVVIHTAALKHVGLCEESPRDAVLTNVVGVQNLIDAAYENGVSRVLFTSSDKAVNPTNVMGTSKLMGERLMTAANGGHRDGPVFASTRFGNVLGSRGSVIPLFADQIRRGGPVTLTDPGMTRFIMTLKEAVQLVVDSVFMARGGEVFVTKMPAIRIEDLARAMIEELAPRHGLDPADVPVEVVGPRPGEKIYEELLNEEEKRRTLELDRFYVVRPASEANAPVDGSYPGLLATSVDEAYNSAQVTSMTVDEVRAYLVEHDLLPT
jgi:FlaA1/EpsC-like NDP-sugar epimerase